MRTNIFFMCLIVAFTACSKDKSNPSNVYSDAKGATITLTNTQWFLTRNNIGGGSVNLNLSGSTNADKLWVETFGDGVRGFQIITLDSKNNFNVDSVVISFSATSVQSGSFTSSTQITACKGTDTLLVTLNSGTLKY